MSISRQEEIIAVLWIIASILSFAFSFELFGWVAAIKGGTDMIASIYFALIEIRIKKNENT